MAGTMTATRWLTRLANVTPVADGSQTANFNIIEEPGGTPGNTPEGGKMIPVPLSAAAAKELSLKVGQEYTFTLTPSAG